MRTLVLAYSLHRHRNSSMSQGSPAAIHSPARNHAGIATLKGFLAIAAIVRRRPSAAVVAADGVRS